MPGSKKEQTSRKQVQGKIEGVRGDLERNKVMKSQPAAQTERGWGCFCGWDTSPHNGLQGKLGPKEAAFSTFRYKRVEKTLISVCKRT